MFVRRGARVRRRATSPEHRTAAVASSACGLAARLSGIVGSLERGTMMPNDAFSELEWRGLVYEATEGLRDVLAREAVTLYIGFDPTAASLHVGSLLPMMALARMQRFGHSPIAIAGGGTGMIGDPSGKTVERQLLSVDQVDANLAGIRAQLAKVLDFDASPNPARIVNNGDWLRPLRYLDFLRDIGKHFTVNYMLAKESVKRRLDQEDGVSYTEFSYLMLQAYDFLTLFDRYGCTLQMGGSDQWGNITAGCDLVRKLRGARAHGLVMPLVTTSSGVKFGKTEAGAVWLDASLTSPFRFYQFWVNTDDRDAAAYLKYFTFLGRGEIRALEDEIARAPEAREAQRVLAREVTRTIHGGDAAVRAERASALLFGERIAELDAGEIVAVFDDVPSTSMPAAAFAGAGAAVADVLVATKLASSKGEAARLVRGGGVYVNNRRVADERARLTLDSAVSGRLFVLRRGARQYHLVLADPAPGA
ncbi:MAG TPA: tyrosine--tRNA ligase [Vicinamibacterales bacterium]|nr:tyrosine--tRNA ligase [Vicinamibacterales bacterium]